MLDMAQTEFHGMKGRAPNCVFHAFMELICDNDCKHLFYYEFEVVTHVPNNQPSCDLSLTVNVMVFPLHLLLTLRVLLHAGYGGAGAEWQRKKVLKAVDVRALPHPFGVCGDDNDMV